MQGEPVPHDRRNLVIVVHDQDAFAHHVSSTWALPPDAGGRAAGYTVDRGISSTLASSPRARVSAAPSPTGTGASGAAINSSTSWRARSSLCCTGGDFL